MFFARLFDKFNEEDFEMFFKSNVEKGIWDNELKEAKDNGIWFMLSKIAPLEFIEKYVNRYWNWGSSGLSSNSTITPEFIENHLNEGWCWGPSGLSSNPAITPAFVEKHSSNYPFTIRTKRGELVTTTVCPYPRLPDDFSSSEQHILLKKCSFLTLVDKVMNENTFLTVKVFGIEKYFEPSQESISNKYCSLFDILKYCSEIKCIPLLDFILKNRDELFQ